MANDQQDAEITLLRREANHTGVPEADGERAGLYENAILQALMRPWVDRTIAVVAVIPTVYYFAQRGGKFGFTLPHLIYILNTMVLVGTMVFRRSPVRITTNPLYWLLAFVASYWGFLTINLYDSGRSLAPQWTTDSLALTSAVAMLWARLSLGRNIGYVPAQRNIVTRGAYRYVRHPIYTAIFLSIMSNAIAFWSLTNAILCALGILWFVIKSLVEEQFLRRDPQYASYLREVRWRWFPGIA